MEEEGKQRTQILTRDEHGHTKTKNNLKYTIKYKLYVAQNNALTDGDHDGKGSLKYFA